MALRAIGMRPRVSAQLSNLLTTKPTHSAIGSANLWRGALRTRRNAMCVRNGRATVVARRIV